MPNYVLYFLDYSLLPINAFAQQWSGSSSISGNIYRTGNVGIGQTSPTTLLHIKTEDLAAFGGGLYRAPNIRLEYQTNNNNNYVGNDFWDITSGSSLDFSYGTSTSNMVSQMNISSSTFHYKGSVTKIGLDENQLSLGAQNAPSSNLGQFIAFGANSLSGSWQFTGNSSNNGGAIIQGDDKGGTLSEEVAVRTGWADYVFNENYKLLPLEAVETHILEKGHLHNTPSAAELNGTVNLGDTTVNQQEKIEEIYLHLIEMNKEIKALKAENESLKSEIETLK